MCSAKPVRRMQPLLGTFVEIGIEHTQSNRLNPGKVSVPSANLAFAAAFATLQQLHQTLSFQLPNSALSLLNQYPGQWQPMSGDALQVLKLAKAMTKLSDCQFNCTIGGALIETGKLPNHGGKYLCSGNADDISIDHNRVKLERPVRITLDGIAKGFAVDKAIATLKQQGVVSGWVNAGGDLRCFGNTQLPIHLRRVDGTLVSAGLLNKGAIATSQSGSSAEFPALIVDNSGKVAAIAESFSVLARFAWRADALTKVAANTPLLEREKRVAALGGQLVLVS